MADDKLYESKNLSGIDFGNYVESLARSLDASCNPDPKRIKVLVNVETESPRLKIDAAIPCALILNELIMNGFKHAFPDNRTGEIHVRFQKAINSDVNYELIVSDNGVGIPANLEPANSTSLGLQLITVLADQVDADLILNRENGTSFTLACRCPH